MVLDNPTSRYQSATEALQALYDLTGPITSKFFTDNSSIDTISLKDSDAPTEPWNN